MQNNALPIIPFSSLAPYLSVLVAEQKAPNTVDNIHMAIIDFFVEKKEIKERDISSIDERAIGNIGKVIKTNYIVEKAPSWAPESGEIDIENHCFLSFQVNDFFAFYFSEKGLKDEVRGLFGMWNGLESVYPVNISQLYYNFVNEDEVKMLWLSDISGKSSFKVGSKVLGGDSVADTLDPILDQFYMMSAVRTKITATEEEKTSIGINPFKSSIWRGPCGSWDDFENRVVEILDKLNTNKSISSKPISILAYPIFDLISVKEAYDFTIMEYDALPESAPEPTKNLLREFESSYHFEHSESLFESKNINLDLYYKKEKVATYNLEPSLEQHRLNFEYTVEYKKDKKGLARRMERLFNKPELMKCWFESGHAMIGGMVFKTEYRDVSFKNFIFADFENYNIFNEKPLNSDEKVDLTKIGLQRSLFCWTKNLWTSRWRTKNEFLTTDKKNGWLYCDDGAGEKADFIHLEDNWIQPILTFIHIKAAKKSMKTDGTNRRLSVGAHDIVVNQAIKNIRYYDRKKLTESLDKRVSEAKSKKCWHDGKDVDASCFLEALRERKDAGSLKTRVIIIQPHTRKSIYENTNSNVQKQLDTLLVSANNAISSTDAEFYVIGFDDTSLTSS